MSMEEIAIGKTLWVKNNGQWQRTDSPVLQTTMNGLEGQDTYLQDLKYEGKQTVNGLPCWHFTLDTDVDESGQGMGGMSSHVSGDLWVANRSDLPHVMIRLNLHIVMSANSYSPLNPHPIIPTPSGAISAELTEDLQYDLTKINVPVRIVPPQ